ncbi:hypothetical protein HK100_007257, partial [Physocladia obscura]
MTSVKLKKGREFAEAVSRKDSGNLHYQKHNYAAAIAEYSRAIDCFDAAAVLSLAHPQLPAASSPAPSLTAWFPFSQSTSNQNATYIKNPMPPVNTQQPQPIKQPETSQNSLPAPIPTRENETTKLSFSQLLEFDRNISNATPSPRPLSNSDLRFDQQKISPELELLAQLYSNRALIHMISRNFDSAWVDANSAIRLRPDWIK